MAVLASDLRNREKALFVLLEWLYENGGRDAPSAFGGLDLEAAGIERAQLRSLVRDLREQGWVTAHPQAGRMGSRVSPVALSDTGQRRVERAREERQNATARRQAARQALLEFLAAAGGDHVDASVFNERSGATFWGAPFTYEDTVAASQDLIDFGLVRGHTRADGVLYDATLTGEGRQCVEDHAGDIRAFRTSRAGAGSTYQQQNFVYGTAATVVQGEKVRVEQHSGLDVRQLVDVLGALRVAMDAALPSLDTEEREELEFAVGSVEAEASAADPDQGRLRTAARLVRGLVIKSAESAATKAGGEVGHAALQRVADSVHHLLQLLS